MEWIARYGWLRATHGGYLVGLAFIPLFVVLSCRLFRVLSPIRAGMVIGLRALVVTLLILALAGMEHVRKIDDQTAVFVLDTSQSVPQDCQQRGFQFVRDATRWMRAGKDQVALVSVGGIANVEQPALSSLVVDRPAGGGRADQTNLAAGVRMATALLSPGMARRLIILSDGNENAGDVMAEADRCRAEGIPIDVFPLTYVRHREVLFERLSAPAIAQADDRISLDMVLRSTEPVRGRIVLHHNDALVTFSDETSFGAAVELHAGLNRFSVPIELSSPGVHRFHARFIPDRPDADGIPENNEAQAVTMVGGRQHVLVLENAGESASSDALVDALERSGIECVQRTVDQVTLPPESLMEYGLVLLSNIPAHVMSDAIQQTLSSYVRDLGGGLIVVGGDQAYSVGGYYKTPLEAILPVETDRKKILLLSLSMVIVVDQSGSMDGEKIALAKRAAMEAVGRLTSSDRIGVVAFASDHHWALPLTPCVNRADIRKRIAEIGVGGGTNMYPPLADAAAALCRENTNLRHVVVLTDGQTIPGDFDGLAARMADAGITLSAVAIGSDADLSLLSRLARRTGGRMYHTGSGRALPQILARETIIAGRSGLYEQSFTPELRGSAESPIVMGITPQEVPPLHGHVITVAKPLASVPLIRRTDRGADPILAHWQAGLGRVVAFTSGMWPRWGRDWAAWPGFPKFWSQAVRWAARPADSTDFEVTTAVDGDYAKITLSAVDPVPLLHGGIEAVARVVTPDGAAQLLELRRSGAGQFEGTFPVRNSGSYIVRVVYSWFQDGQNRTGQIQACVSRAYARELRDLRSSEERLLSISRRTDGRLLRPENPEAVFEPSSIRPVQSRRPVWDLFVWMALPVFLLDVAVRRLAVDPMEVMRRIRQAAGGPVGSAPVVVPTRLARLKEIRWRVRGADHAVPAAPRESDERSSARRPIMSDAASARTERKASGERRSGGLSPGPAVNLPTDPPQDPGTTTNRLLRTKRRIRNRVDQTHPDVGTDETPDATPRAGDWEDQ